MAEDSQETGGCRQHASPARMIEVISPAGFEHFFRELADMMTAGPPQFADVMALADRYGLQFGSQPGCPI